MGQIKVMNWVTLDGVMQGPGRPGEDPRDGFADSGWAAPYADERAAARMGERMGGPFHWLLGHRTYVGLMTAWEAQGGPMWDGLRETPKHVVTRDAATQLAWPASQLVAGDAATTVAELRRHVDETLVVLGSGELVQTLAAAGLVDEYLLLIAPVTLGRGRRLLGTGLRTELRLLDAEATATGALLATYVPAGAADGDGADGAVTAA